MPGTKKPESVSERAPTPAPATRRRPDAGGPAAARHAGVETGGPRGPEPTRYGDWEIKGICVDF